MTVVTKKVKNRRTVRYETLDDLLADAKQLAGGEVRMLGNWSLGQVFSHVAGAFEASLDGFGDFKAPWIVRTFIAPLMKKSLLRKPMNPGFTLPKAAAEFLPQETTPSDGLQRLTTVVDRYRNEIPTHPHPLLGKLTPEEYRLLMLRHAEMHMSFAVPVEN